MKEETASDRVQAEDNYSDRLQQTLHHGKAESFVAVASFVAAVGLAFVSLIISEDHDIASGVLMMCAQFLMLTATIFGLDYKLGTWFYKIKRNG